ncbi:MAG: Hsp70 family protein [Myxococcaceae bacterium]|nr:Hsp70 family protein [Myxococcaceae bacterium]
MASSSILGIDFGTTNTAATYFDKTGRLRLVPVTDKSFVLPSVVWYHAGDKAIVGHAARTQIIDDPRHTIFGAKRFLGRRFDSEFVALHKDRFAFDLVPGPDGYAAIHVYGQVRPLTDVVHVIIKQILTLANHAAGEPFSQCVLTVPAHASIRQREAVRRAAEKSGLEVRAIINEPTAAALYYANLRNPEQTVLVFDLGGGTFDATLMSVQNRVVKVLATGGDAFLGGANFDEAIVEGLVDEFERQSGVRIRGNKLVMQRLIFAAESAKIALSVREEAQMRVAGLTQKEGAFVDFNFSLTRAQLEQLVFQLIERLAASVDDVLQRANMTPEQVDELVLVGGMTRMPAVRQRFAHFRRTSTDKEVHPDLGVAIGAGVLGRNLARGIVGLADVVPMPISAMLPGGRTVEVIPANTPVPCTKTLPLEALPMWNAPIPIAIFESLSTTAVDREILGTLHVPPQWRAAQPGGGQLELKMGHDFTLRATLIADNGARTPVQLVDPKPITAV